MVHFDSGRPVRGGRSPAKRWFYAAVGTALTGALLVSPGISMTTPASGAILDPGPVGAGFTVTAGDLSFILKQIKIAEAHSATRTSDSPCGTLVARPGDGILPDTDQVPDILTSFGLRTVDGSCNNLKTGNERWAASDEVFPRLTNPNFRGGLTNVPGFPVTTVPSYEVA